MREVNRVTKEEFKDGIAFLQEGEEVAFFSIFTKHITYNDFGIRKAYPKWNGIGCVCIPIEDNTYIIEEIRKYLLANN